MLKTLLKKVKKTITEINKKLIHEHLMQFFKKHEIIYKHKFGF